MLPTLRIDSARLDARTEFSLWRRGDEWLVRVGSTLLMSSRSSASEEALAERALARVPSPRSVLVGGLGLGFTLRAVLDRVPSSSVVTVCELVPAVVDWNRRHVGGLTGHPLEDPRTRVVVEDVFAQVARAAAAFDAILLDVDNGPEPLSMLGNRRLYQAVGARACRRALRPGGVLAVWSATRCDRFERLLVDPAPNPVEIPAPRDARRSSNPARSLAGPPPPDGSHPTEPTPRRSRSAAERTRAIVQ